MQRELEPIKAITFDVGGTLIDAFPSVGHIYAEVAAEHGFPGLSAEALTRRFAAAWKGKRNFDYTVEAWKRLVDSTFGDWVDPVPSRSFFDALYRRFDLPTAWQIYDEVLPVLENLRTRGFRLGIVSNWDRRLRPLLNRLSLSGYFEVIVVSCEAGCQKPAPAIFQQAAVALGLKPQALLHVGDSRSEDVAGAQAAGFQAWRLDRHAPSGVEPAQGSLRDLLSWL